TAFGPACSCSDSKDMPAGQRALVASQPNSVTSVQPRQVKMSPGSAANRDSRSGALQVDREAGPFARLAGDGDSAALGFGEVLDDRQPQAGAAALPPAGPVGAVEALEDVL